MHTLCFSILVPRIILVPIMSKSMYKTFKFDYFWINVDFPKSDNIIYPATFRGTLDVFR